MINFCTNLSMDEIQNVLASEVFPKQPLESDDSSLTVPFPPLPGEGPQYLGSTTDGIIVLSNYRLYLEESTIFNIPLGLIEQVECRDIFYLYIHCKDARTFRCTFPTNEDCQKWYKRLLTSVLPPSKVDEQFGFAFYLWIRDEHKDDLYSTMYPPNSRDPKVDTEIQSIATEAERMGFDLENVWRISKINSDYKLCPSYPRYLLVPASVPDQDLEMVASFRYYKRIPAVVWRHQQNGCVIARCSQPEVGWFCWRSNEDETLIQAIADACVSDPGCELKNGAQDECYSLKSEIDTEASLLVHDKVQGTEKPKKLLIIDARSYTAAVANRAKGGGCECPEYYPNCEIQFLSLANIHYIRKSFTTLRSICVSIPDQATWLSSLEKTNWLHHISGLIRASLLVVNAVDVEKRPVLVHCSDGWDRTPQIVALAELMMDPYYRTRKGFQVLVEREWLEFGHKFADRCGQSTGSDDPNERSPVFLQWLDCVHQLLNQFSCYFEFNQQFLVKLVHHTYSCLFGTFLCNTDQDRRTHTVRDRTFSIWAFLNNSTNFHNYLYNYSSEVLRPSCQMKDIRFWNEVYLPNYSNSLSKAAIPSEPQVIETVETSTEGPSLVKAKSYDNLSSICHLHTRHRRSSDSNIAESASAFVEGLNIQLQPDGSGHDGVTGCYSFENFLTTCKNSALDNNGNLSVDSNGKCKYARRTKSAPSEVCSNSFLTVMDLKIDGSTDTLVSENGIIKQDQTKECVLVNHCDSVSNGKLTSSASTSTTDLSASSVTPNASQHVSKTADLTEAKWSLCQSVVDYISNKKTTFSSGSASRSYSTPHHSRTPSSGFPATPCDDHPNDVYRATRSGLQQTLDLDGLSVARDEIQEQIHRIIWYYKTKVENLEDNLWVARNSFVQVCRNCQSKDGNYVDSPDDVASLADSACSGEQHIGSSAGSDVSSFEQVEDPSTTTLWVPDHAVSHCMGCEAKFWAGRRKHHCRKCGQVFCANCSSQMMPVPTERLFHPVRVCYSCFAELQPQCRQAVVSCDKLPKPVVTAAST